LLIGDAAHVMRPIAGVGINYAIQDAVVAANVLSDALRESQERLVGFGTRYLAKVQRRRETPSSSDISGKSTACTDCTGDSRPGRKWIGRGLRTGFRR
jgi:FAD binding domain